MSGRTPRPELKMPVTLIMTEPNTERKLMTAETHRTESSLSPIKSSDGSHSPDDFPAPRRMNSGKPGLEVRSHSEGHLLKGASNKNINIVINVTQDKETINVT